MSHHLQEAKTKHFALGQLDAIADLDRNYHEPLMSRSQRLERWAELLEKSLVVRLFDTAPDREPARKNTGDHAR